MKTFRITYAIGGSEIERTSLAGGDETEIRLQWERVFPHRIILRIEPDRERQWLRDFCRCEITDADRRAFAAIEKPAVSPVLDR